jgi:hypothetical protein
MSLMQYLAKNGTKLKSGLKEAGAAAKAAKAGEEVAAGGLASKLGKGAGKVAKYAEENPGKTALGAAAAGGAAYAASDDDDDDEPLEHIMRKAKKKLREYLD